METQRRRISCFASLLGIALAAASSSLSCQAAADPDATPEAQTQPGFEYPQNRQSDGLALVLHAPQIRQWPQFQRFEALMAVEVSAPDSATVHYATATISGETEVDLPARLVWVGSPRVGAVVFKDPVPDGYRDAVVNSARQERLAIPLDLFLAYLSDDVLSEPPPPGFNAEPPPIHFRTEPTLLLHVDGELVKQQITGTWLQYVVNANWPLYRAGGDDATFYLLEQDRWLTSPKLETGWKAARSLPEEFSRLPDEPQYAPAKSAIPLVEQSRKVPAVLFVETPSELIVSDGNPKVESVTDTAGLEYVTNTDSSLFRLDGAWYYLVAGRWFSSDSLKRGPWRYVPTLPEAFRHIPADHPRAAVRASIPGTVEARMAAFEALIPTRTTVAVGSTAPVEVSYAGEPKFEPVPDSEVSRAVNSGSDVIEHAGRYYLVYAGVWYDSSTAEGPWTVTAIVPEAIYRIPPSSPSYNVTHVTVVESTPQTVVYSYPPAYSSNVYVVYGVPYYGTGWYYPPYVWGPYYYAYPVSYGYGSWYNPATGGYGSRSAWYGPYGGYSYNQGYNPRTGRYGYAETAWDGDELASYGETYNPRTGVSTSTSRYYGDDKDRSEMERTSRRGDELVHTERTVDYDDRTARTERQSSSGGSSNVTRQASGGNVVSSGTITMKDGTSYSVAGEADRGGGTTTISGTNGQVDVSTKRQNQRSVSTIEGSGGGQGVSMSGQGPGRTTIGRSANDDLYAGHDGNVYKRTDAGWQHYEDGDWAGIETPDRPQNQPERASSDASRDLEARRQDAYGTRDRSQSASGYGSRSTSNRNMSQLNRDYSARHRGNAQFNQRSMGGMRSRGRR